MDHVVKISSSDLLASREPSFGAPPAAAAAGGGFVVLPPPPPPRAGVPAVVDDEVAPGADEDAVPDAVLPKRPPLAGAAVPVLDCG